MAEREKPGVSTIEEHREKQRVLKEIFETGIQILQERGKVEGKLLKKQVYRFHLNSEYPPLWITLVAGQKPEKTNQVKMKIEGRDSLEVRSYRDGFMGYEVDENFFPTGYEELNHNGVLAFREAIKQIVAEFK